MIRRLAVTVTLATLAVSGRAQMISVPDGPKIVATTQECVAHELARSCDLILDDEINALGCVDSSTGVYHKEYRLEIAAAEDMQITVSASAFAPTVAIKSAYGEVIAIDENNSEFGVIRLSARLPQPGTYFFIIGATRPDRVGKYRFSFLCGNTEIGRCRATADTLCLNNNRFKVKVAWRDSAGNRGIGKAIGITNDAGYFWFFANTNVELVVKALDGRSVNGKWWLFYGSLTNVEFTMTVTDMETGRIRSYTNRMGDLASVGDTDAF